MLTRGWLLSHLHLSLQTNFQLSQCRGYSPDTHPLLPKGSQDHSTPTETSAQALLPPNTRRSCSEQSSFVLPKPCLAAPHIGPYLIGSKLHSCFPFHQSCADLHDYRLDGVCAAPALRDRAHTAGRSVWMGARAEPPRGRGRPSPSPMQAAQALSCRQEQDLASRGESSKPGTRLRALGLTCLVSSSMQMAPPPRTYLGEGIWAKLCQRWTQPCPPPALQESCLLQPKEKKKTQQNQKKGRKTICQPLLTPLTALGTQPLQMVDRKESYPGTREGKETH